MTNKQRQKSLDKKKWLDSEIAERDLSGSMYYCTYCAGTEGYERCCYSQEEREQYNLCAKAYNRLQRNG